ncbi:transcriptional regulator, MarR family [Beutenbergia cavernae DSM 12333]|uniref:Transcriptional regulator, MarR family n=1 Tax=Beutenbergia cavernae (strain ATCC BAA-8 / DSM 12333 / CCUG 43141 / JCM 11478 / NBRC 16432 / NCIMB 13614 / HKI 0122) TaxID=471853 RepID=C5BZL6_BEUC1|nr:MarR family transcriptional regulator [Beutenbergia cavernae]ACQ79188.1 transcriptional regulator, MarR family [Beutenbergia cavernae DSM 12333]
MTATPPLASASGASATTPPAEPVNLGWSLAMVLRSWQEHADHAVADVPHGTRGFHVLCVVTSGEPPTQVALAAALAIDRTVMTYLLDDLESAGLVERRADPRDRRARRIAPTAHGRRVLAAARRRVQAAEEVVLGGISPADRAALREALGAASLAIRAAAPGTEPCLAVESVLPSR